MHTGGNDSDTQVGEPQAAINEFWDGFITKKPAKVTKTAAAECCTYVERIVKECHCTNEKFTDPKFNSSHLRDKSCLESLMYRHEDEDATDAQSTTTASGRTTSSSNGLRLVHRVDWIFENPQFVLNGFSSSDLK
ncbi:hypothetical protein COCC4DRAFT_46027 [Bipolaris maydis ATCC 48331]|uniref:Uncharacterized protein n=2 Tax=Cochliobolus heterostrophus TaxID=5016 RepID=M2SPR1_COCH5|nr:uncharacterized protein COCC4DRAFT_46027 [Bipolaris maydis ATCC 48331]EMD87295.1 hypothetical protein COCHEDRAFT_1033739 [Bipolaris maydis C5]KAJ6203490.1 hypothetical protein PSV09DRAFT_2263575 [Bipolaris maydis]ENH98492.1 hypothetical protein COCC4DRAFT_46027 [Bipolaris maydis ATCC 48331]KAJ6212296.1 hypothetical protein PSV09DRAFT_1033739 [Bipolaris maydis]KAJ6265121.1 hypothetical protein PSV08DRAFT_252940 [Bipolaris maydis]